MKILTSKDDNFLYDRLISLFKEIRLIQGNTALNSTLRRHIKLKNYLVSKQSFILNSLEETYFHPDGSLDREALDEFIQK